MSSAIRQVEHLRRQRAVVGVGVLFLATVALFIAWSLTRGERALAGLLGGIAVAIGALLVAARRGHVRLAGYAFSLLALAGVVGGALLRGNPGYAPFYFAVAVVLGAVSLPPRDVAVVFGLGLVGEAVVFFAPRSSDGVDTLGGVYAEGATLFLLVGAVALASSWSIARLLRDLLKRDAEAQAADERAEALTLQLEQSQRMEALGRLAGGVAHDFNNLLAIMRSCAAAVGDGAGSPEDLTDLVTAIDRGAALTGQLLAFSRRDVVRAQRVDLCEVVRQTSELLQRLLGADVRLTLVPCEKPCPVWAAPSQLEQVVMNLVVNARDAMQGRGALELRLEHADDAALGRVCRLSVRDDGPGMSEEVRARIFEPFFTTKPAGQGTGLGLATAYGIVTRGGGRIDVASAPGQGATFTVVLPLASGAAGHEAPAPAAATAAPAAVVHVVDDEAMLRHHMERILGAAGFQVQLFERAEPLLEDGAPPCDVLVTDVNLPDASGVALAEALLARRPGLRLVLVSGFTADPTATGRLLERGARFLAKPFTPEDLVRAVTDAPEVRPAAK